MPPISAGIWLSQVQTSHRPQIKNRDFGKSAFEASGDQEAYPMCGRNTAKMETTILFVKLMFEHLQTRRTLCGSGFQKLSFLRSIQREGVTQNAVEDGTQSGDFPAARLLSQQKRTGAQDLIIVFEKGGKTDLDVVLQSDQRRLHHGHQPQRTKGQSTGQCLTLFHEYVEF